MYHAHFENMINPGSYEKVLNKMYKANNLPALKVPVVPQSDKVIAKMTEAMNLSSKQDHQTEQQTQQASQPE